VTIQRPDRRDAGGDQPHPRRPAGKLVVPLWVWLVFGGFGALLLMGCACGGVATLFWFQGRTNPRVTEENYKKLHTGMTEAEVKAVMGEPNANGEAYRDAKDGGDDPRDYGGRIMRWRNGDEYIQVRFGPDGKAEGVGYQSSDRNH